MDKVYLSGALRIDLLALDLMRTYHLYLRHVFFVVGTLYWLSGVRAADLTQERALFFEEHIRPVLIEHCERCHGLAGDAPKGGLRVDSRDGLLAGGDTSAAVVPGRPDQSLILEALRYESLEMPPSGKLPEHILDNFEEWIRQGAFDPRVSDAPVAAARRVDIDAGRKFWSFQPVIDYDPPAVEQTQWPVSDLDRFILARLESNGLKPVADASPSVWLRRVTFDLIGLPPSRKDILSFLEDPSPLAREQVVDALLSSPHFGERWGKHWLDVARFAESSGGGRSMVFNDAWRYRDYCISSFNEDKGIDAFIVEQIAGDLLAHKSKQEEEDHLVATGYLMLGAHNYEEQDKQHLEMDVIDEQIDSIGKGLLGLTLGCVRCHDHKFDPIPTRDYYALAGIFRSTETLVHNNVSRWTERTLPFDADVAEALSLHEGQVSLVESQLMMARERLGMLDPSNSDDGKPIPIEALPGIVLDDTDCQLIGEWKQSRFTKTYIGRGYITDQNKEKGLKTATFLPAFPMEGEYEVRLAYTPGDNRASNVPVSMLTLDGEVEHVVDMTKTPPIDGRFVSLGIHRFDESNQWFVLISNTGTRGYVIVDGVQFLPASIIPQGSSIANDAKETSEDARIASKEDVKALEKKLRGLKKSAPVVPKAMAVQEAEVVQDCHICIRGEVHNQGAAVPRGFIQVVTDESDPAIPATSSGRRELAAWIAADKHPLTTRVYVNRIWHHLFGRGIVQTVDNFGTRGERPSHPELLDFLARRFAKSGWSTKSVIRDIVLSRTYGLSTQRDDVAAVHDPENTLLWRMNVRRLDAESMRDAMLVVSGEIDLGIGGPCIQGSGAENKGSTKPTEYTFEFEDVRRSIYTPVFRNRRLELFEIFDGADPNQVHGQRNVSTVSTQALLMLNSPFVMNRARAAAKHLLGTQEVSQEERLRHVYLSALGRLPYATEWEHLQQVTSKVSAVDTSQIEIWSQIYQALFASIDFRYVE